MICLHSYLNFVQSLKMTPGGATIQVLPELNPPGWPYVNDGLSAEQKEAWSQLVSSWMQVEITAKNPDGSPLTGGGGIVRTPLAQFFNGTVTAYDTTQPPQTISWTGFPGIVYMISHFSVSTPPFRVRHF